MRLRVLALCLFASSMIAQCTNATLVSGVSRLSYVATVDGSFTYYGDQVGNIYRVPINGGSPTTIATVPGVDTVGIAVDSNNVYFGVNQFAPDLAAFVAGTGSIKSAPKTGGGPVTTLASGLNGVAQVLVDDTFVYWTSFGTQDPSGIPRQDGAVQRVVKSGGAVQNLVSNVSA